MAEWRECVFAGPVEQNCLEDVAGVLLLPGRHCYVNGFDVDADTCARCPVPPQIEVLREVRAYLEATGCGRMLAGEQDLWLERLRRATDAAKKAVEDVKG